MLIKYNFLKKSRGQSLSEYAILLAVVAAAVVSMQLLVKGRFNAMLYDTAQQFGDPEYTQSYDPLQGGEISSSIQTGNTAGLSRKGLAGDTEFAYKGETTNALISSNREYIYSITGVNDNGGGGGGGGACDPKDPSCVTGTQSQLE